MSIPSMIHTTRLFRQALVDHPTLPHPGGGQTLLRWQVLADLAAQDLAACKLAEAHWDAQAILHDLHQSHLSRYAGNVPPLWGVWAASHPQAQLQLQREGTSARLRGSKYWCSGAQQVSHALLTADSPQGPVLCMVYMQSPGIHMDTYQWQALGMRNALTPPVHFDYTPATVVAPSSAYLERPGFWHGAAGIAACWYGASNALAQHLRRQLDVMRPHTCAHLGAMFAGLQGVRALLQSLAMRIDAQPHSSHLAQVQAVRALMREVATEVIERSSRALGSASLCLEAEHAQRSADLAVWITQHHAERDLETLGRVCQPDTVQWEL